MIKGQGQMVKLLRRVNYRHILPDLLLITGSLYLSLYMRVGWDVLPQHLPTLHRYIIFFVLVKLTTFICFGIYDIIWRYISMLDGMKLFRTVLISSSLIVESPISSMQDAFRELHFLLMQLLQHSF